MHCFLCIPYRTTREASSFCFLFNTLLIFPGKASEDSPNTWILATVWRASSSWCLLSSTFLTLGYCDHFGNKPIDGRSFSFPCFLCHILSMLLFQISFFLRKKVRNSNIYPTYLIDHKIGRHCVNKNKKPKTKKSQKMKHKA